MIQRDGHTTFQLAAGSPKCIPLIGKGLEKFHAGLEGFASTSNGIDDRMYARCILIRKLVQVVHMTSMISAELMLTLCVSVASQLQVAIRNSHLKQLTCSSVANCS